MSERPREPADDQAFGKRWKAAWRHEAEQRWGNRPTPRLPRVRRVLGGWPPPLPPVEAGHLADLHLAEAGPGSQAGHVRLGLRLQLRLPVAVRQVLVELDGRRRKIPWRTLEDGVTRATQVPMTFFVEAKLPRGWSLVRWLLLINDALAVPVWAGWFWRGSSGRAELRRATLPVSDAAGTRWELPAVPPPPPLPDPAPSVEIIIPTRDLAPMLRRAVETLRKVTRYPHYRLTVVDNGSRHAETHALLDEIRAAGGRVLEQPGEFNYSALNNAAAARSDADLLCLLNNDVEITEPGWLEALVRHAVRHGVGAVGARLLFPDGAIQHAGVAVGLCGVAGHPLRGCDPAALPPESPGRRAHECLAVTGACLVVRREVYEAQGGLNERELAVAYNDVDFCLRLHAAGLQNLCVPEATLTHHESRSRGLDLGTAKLERHRAEAAYIREKWAAVYEVGDPFWSRGFSPDHEVPVQLS